MKDKTNYIIIIILVLAVIMLLLKPKSTIVVDSNKLDSIERVKDQILLERDSIVSYYDSLLLVNRFKLDSIENSKNKTITYYEERIKNLADIKLVSDDSITKYISSRIHNR